MGHKRHEQTGYALSPDAMLQHAIGVALGVACGLVTQKHARALATLCSNEALTERASRVILRQMLRQLADRAEPTPADFKRLLAEMVAIADAS